MKSIKEILNNGSNDETDLELDEATELEFLTAFSLEVFGRCMELERWMKKFKDRHKTGDDQK